MSESAAEMPGGPQLDHYVGRGVEGIEEADDKTWEIILTGNVRIKNYNLTIDAPDNIGGLTFMTAIYSELDTRLIFGITAPNANPDANVEVVLNPTEYSISDPQISNPESFPQRPPESAPEAVEEQSEEEPGGEA